MSTGQFPENISGKYSHTTYINIYSNRNIVFILTVVFVFISSKRARKLLIRFNSKLL